MKTITETLVAWGCAEIQHYCGRGAIVLTQHAILERCTTGTDVCRVAVPVVLESRETTTRHWRFSQAEVARITGKTVVL
ncbi:MAG TPA: hypothetical protein VLI39_07530 [Sedimentisphaerales bacterium]|nr:hypothetical protein [Sedimentisphaerales bacterium]